jgi:hypothetical protein
LCFFLNIRDRVSHPYKTTVKIVVECFLIYTLSDNRRKDKSFWTIW